MSYLKTVTPCTKKSLCGRFPGNVLLSVILLVHGMLVHDSKPGPVQ